MKKNEIKFVPQHWGDEWYLEMQYLGDAGTLVKDVSFGPTFTSKAAAKAFADSVKIVRKP